MTRPDATLDQLRTLIDLANERHLHDAEQWLRERVEAAEERMASCKHGRTEAHPYVAVSYRGQPIVTGYCLGPAAPKDGAR